MAEIRQTDLWNARMLPGFSRKTDDNGKQISATRRRIIPEPESARVVQTK